MQRSDDRLPRGYDGVGHMTIGSDILAVEQSLGALATNGSAIPRVLSAVSASRLRGLHPDVWYPISWLLEMLEQVVARIGRYGLIKLGRTLFRLSHESRVKPVARCGRDIIHGIDGMYHAANRGQKIGGWRVLHFDDDRAVLEKTTPHHCSMEEGLLAAGLLAVGCPAVVTQESCFREGADACRFVILRTSRDSRWT